MTAPLLLSFIATKSLIAITPGPAVLLVLSHGLERGRSRWAALGIVLVNALYFLAAATGLGAMLALSPGAFLIAKWVACVYLFISGVRIIAARFVPKEVDREIERSPWRSLGAGMLLQLANPNALLFFVAVLPTFIEPRDPLAPQMATLGLTALLLDCCILAAYGVLAKQLRKWADTPHIRLAANRIVGGLLIAVALITVLR